MRTWLLIGGFLATLAATLAFSLAASRDLAREPGGFLGLAGILLLAATVSAILLRRLPVSELDDATPGLPGFGEGVSLAAALALVLVCAVAGVMGPFVLPVDATLATSAREELPLLSGGLVLLWAAPAIVHRLAALGGSHD